MKKASGWIIIAIGALCLVFFAGLFIGRSTVRTPASESQTNATVSSTLAPSGSVTSKININTANSQQLQQLPGIGQVIAERIIAYRTEHGPFASITDLQKVDGIGSGKMANIIELICVED